MDERTKTLIVTGGVLLIILAVIFGTIFYLIQSLRGGRTGDDNRNVLSTATAVPRTGGDQVSPQPISGETKTHQGAGFNLTYPKQWGLLTCANSQHLELDPATSTDQLNVACDVAQKPITVLVGSSNCQGEAVALGNIQLIKQKETISTGVNYKWCTNTDPKLEISHRVSSTGSPATSQQDFSQAIEEMIKSLRLGGSS